MSSKTAQSQLSDPVLQELWKVKDSITERFGSVSEYVAYLRTKTMTVKSPRKTSRNYTRLAGSKGEVKVAA